MSMLKLKKPDYSDGRTKQSFKDECDINQILKKAQVTGSISHLNKYGGEYADFGEFDFHEAQTMIARGRQIFEELPSEVRKDFANDPGEFFKFANDPDNIGKLKTLLPQVAEPGSYFPDVSGRNPNATMEPPLPEPTEQAPEPTTDAPETTNET